MRLVSRINTLTNNVTRSCVYWVEETCSKCMTIKIHQEEIMLNWDLITRGEDIVKIDPLK